MDTGWTTSDVWLLRSIAGRDAATGSTLRGVIGTADYLNHAIPTEPELTGAVDRLSAAGLAGYDVAAGRFWLTPDGHASPAHRGAFAAATAALPPAVPVPAPLTLPPGAYAAAVAEYLRTFS
ncbi:hypothetical protein ACFO1B_41180 [Dactylosporangium siamense]|uniref:Uncharacterized protein n=1 Tax=Dactylosporangium siamense TaxID=685454 RepID=A0A919U9I1_9ACTN|nr:hypothetical protein [Dactylosporangium siamense]GIG42673.1 hypothetical protein Dsi01nite_007140 [Dactylosporangium siamense]